MIPGECLKMSIKDAHFSDYVEIYNNLDNLLWKMPAFFATLSTAVIGILSITFSKKDIIPTIILSTLLLALGIIFVIGSYGMYRIMIQHLLIISELAKIEYSIKTKSNNSGYFCKRKERLIKGRMPYSATLFISFFGLLGIILFFLGFLFLIESNFLNTIVLIVKKYSSFLLPIMIGLILLNEWLIRLISKKKII